MWMNGELFNTVGIAGIGLIGGSLAKDIRTFGLARRILGWNRTTAHAERALELGLVDDIVESAEAAAMHILTHSTGHSEAIIAEDETAQNIFVSLVDSAAVYINASTRFTDGGEFGLGCEMGISTQKLHARGPIGLAEMTSYQYRIKGNGQIR